MKNTKSIVKVVASLALAFILSIAVFGCTRYEPISGDLPDGYEPTPEGKIKLQYYIAATEADKRSVNDWVSAFQRQYPDVQVNAEISNAGKNVIVSQIASKTVGDVFFLWETDVYNYASVQKALMPLDNYVLAYEIDTANIFSAIMDMGRVDGKLYMVMRDYNHIVLMYNRDLIKSAQLTDPIELEASNEWTWDKFKEYCSALTTLDEEADVQTVGCQMRLGYAPLYIPFLEGFGGKWYDKENKKVAFNSDPNVLQGVNEMVNFVASNVCKYIAVDTAGTTANAIKDTPSQNSFSSYNSATQVVFRDTEFPSFASNGKEYNSKVIDWDVVSMPHLPTPKVGTGATGFAVFNGTRNADAAAALCLSLYTEDGQRAYNGQEGGSVPNVKSLAEDYFWRVPFEDKAFNPEEGKNYYAFISFPEADTYGQVECVIPPEIAAIVKKYMQNVVPDAVNGVKTVDNTLAELEAEANEKWESIYTG
ncbi:MAG: extracellular solute-binding protein [Clostridia bacterium]|nr:extracellular solute-binding protein [Clostridia bacterium]